MNTYIKKTIESWIKRHPTFKQWLWFFTLWFSGLLMVTVSAYPIKSIIKLLVKLNFGW